MSLTTIPGVGLIAVLLLMPSPGAAQDERGARPEPHPGSAVVTVGDGEHTIAILCDDASRPELGFRTEPNRVTRARSGKSNMVGLSLRPWKETGHVVVSLDRYVAWLPQPASSAGVLTLEIDMSPISIVRDGTPALLTYDMWQAGERPPGQKVRAEATCGLEGPAAPSYRRVTPPDAGR
jgi:hypothetical protein